MALEAVVFPQDPFVYKDLFNLESSSSSLSFIHDQDEDFYYLPNQTQNSPILLDHHYNFNYESSQRVDSTAEEAVAGERQDGGGSGRPGRRRRGRTQKNKEELENQRMTHITVERNRRKQMNEYLSILRSLMPHSYVQRVPSLTFSLLFFILSLLIQTHKRSLTFFFFLPFFFLFVLPYLTYNVKRKWPISLFIWLK